MGMLWSASFPSPAPRHPVQLLLALVGLALGVATIVAVDVATGSAARAFQLSLAAVQGPATHELDGGAAGIDENWYVQLTRTLHVVRANPVVEGYVTVAARPCSCWAWIRWRRPGSAPRTALPRRSGCGARQRRWTPAQRSRS